MELGNLPVEVLSKIASYQVGEPEYVKIQNSKALKDIQNKYKIKYTEPRTRKVHKHQVYRSYNIQREAPHIIQNQKHRCVF